MKSFSPKQGVPGFLFSGVHAGLKKEPAPDLGLIISESPCTAAGVFTKNRIKAAPVMLCRQRLRRGGTARAVLVNSGNANACTGAGGREAAERTCAGVSSLLNVRDRLVLPCSTGVIGVRLPEKTILKALPALIRNASRKGIPDFAQSILTTDTRPKTAALQETAAGETIRMCGIAKGSGMIMPDMATMLAFIVTDVSIDKDLLQRLLRSGVERSFNRISVDGDMSTNDSVLALAGGRSHRTVTGPASPLYRPFVSMLDEVMQRLSRMIVRDGEGATKHITISVSGARTARDAGRAARQVANSALVKTAFFGEDFNWGRIMAALGSSGARFDPDRTAISFNGIPAVAGGQAVAANRARLLKTVTRKEIRVEIDLRSGAAACSISTCDLSYEYVKINADYTT